MHATIRDRLRGSVAEATKRGAVSRGATSTRTNLRLAVQVLSSGLCGVMFVYHIGPQNSNFVISTCRKHSRGTPKSVA